MSCKVSSKATNKLEKLTNKDVLLVPVVNNVIKLGEVKIPTAVKRYLDKVINSKEVKSSGMLYLPVLPQSDNKLLVVELTNNAFNNQHDFIKFCTSLANTVKQHNIKSLIWPESAFLKQENNNSWQAQQIIYAINECLYGFEEYKSKKSKTNSCSINFIISDDNLKEIKNAIKQAIAIVHGKDFAKNLANTPPNICTPKYLGEQAEKLADEYKNLSCKLINKKQLQALKMNALLAVAQGSKESPVLIELSYKGAGDNPDYVFVGKGVTFDTGGNNLKPFSGMLGMKYDMSGGAAVLGLALTCCKLQLPINVKFLIPSVENMPGGGAYRPDDIIESMSGTTIEVKNTDAEGRLILCDAISYARKFKPKAIIDVATLTGACVVALGRHLSALYTNNEDLSNQLLKASQGSHDRVWPMPLGAEYKEQLQSKFADLSNIGGPEAGSITAASFLEHFAKDTPWAHLDVAGTASQMLGGEKYARGRPVALLAQFLINIINEG